MLLLDKSSEQNLINMLQEHAILNQETLQKVEKISNEIGKSKIETIYDLKISTEQEILKLVSSSYSLPIVSLSRYHLTDELKKIVPFAYIRDNFLVPFEIQDNVIKIAISDGSKLSLMKNLKTITQMEPELFAATISDIQDFIHRIEDKTDSHPNQFKKSSLKEYDLEEKKRVEEEIVPIENESEVIKFGNAIIGEAIQMGVSDIHIEPYKKGSRIRFRLD